MRIGHPVICHLSKMKQIKLVRSISSQCRAIKYYKILSLYLWIYNEHLKGVLNCFPQIIYWLLFIYY